MSDSVRKDLKRTLNEALSKNFQTEMGQKVRVERHQIAGSERKDALREVLQDIAKDMQTTGDVPKEMDYLGSFSVHVYYASALNEMAFATLNAPGRCSFNVAEAASAELFGAICEGYGVRRQKKRSGL